MRRGKEDNVPAPSVLVPHTIPALCPPLCVTVPVRWDLSQRQTTGADDRGADQAAIAACCAATATCTACASSGR